MYALYEISAFGNIQKVEDVKFMWRQEDEDSRLIPTGEIRNSFKSQEDCEEQIGKILNQPRTYWPFDENKNYLFLPEISFGI